MVPLDINWLTYGAALAKPQISVTVNLQAGNIKPPIASIRSVYIDNLGSYVPVYVYFPDSGHMVVAQPNSGVWSPVLTENLICVISGDGFTDQTPPSTKVYLINAPVNPFSNIEIPKYNPLMLASPVITRGNNIYTTGFAIPAVGDQTFQSLGLDVAFTGTSVPVLTVQSAGFYYLVGITLNMLKLFSASAAMQDLYVESTGVAGVLYNWKFWAGSTTIPFTNYYQISGMNLKIDATQTWRMRCVTTGTGGVAQLFLNYTYSLQ